jgi:hypothetical protein
MKWIFFNIELNYEYYWGFTLLGRETYNNTRALLEIVFCENSIEISFFFFNKRIDF